VEARGFHHKATLARLEGLRDHNLHMQWYDEIIQVLLIGIANGAIIALIPQR
jgi:hypothetical protein